MADSRSWDWETGEKRISLDSWKDQYQWVEEPYASPDGETVAAIVNVNEGEFTVCANGQAWGETVFDKIWHLRFSPDGRLVASTCNDDQTLVVWDWKNSEEKPLPYGHPEYDYLKYIVFSPEGERLVTTSTNGTTWLWDGITGEPVRCLHESSSMVLMGNPAQVVAFLDDGKHVVLHHHFGSFLWKAKNGKKVNS